MLYIHVRMYKYLRNINRCSLAKYHQYIFFIGKMLLSWCNPISIWYESIDSYIKQPLVKLSSRRVIIGSDLAVRHYPVAGFPAQLTETTRKPVVIAINYRSRFRARDLKMENLIWLRFRPTSLHPLDSSHYHLPLIVSK